MPTKCCAHNCRNNYRNPRYKSGDLKFHRFPMTDTELLKEWTSRMKWKNWIPNRGSRLCTDHFEEKYVLRGFGRNPSLTFNAIPTIFDLRPYKVNGPARSGTVLDVPVGEEPDHTYSYSVKLRLEEERAMKEFADFSMWHPIHFHNDYCLPEKITWAGKGAPYTDKATTEALHKQGLLFIPKHAILIKKIWTWLELDVKGPFPVTENGHQFVLTIMDYNSKWLEVYPMKTRHCGEIAKNISDIITRLGFPIGILSHLDPNEVLKINAALSKHVTLSEGKILFAHPQTTSLDPVTKSLIDRMISSLVKNHAHRWDVSLGAEVFRFCCKEHPSIRQRPLFLLHCCGGKMVATSAITAPEVTMKTFVNIEPQPPSRKVHVQCKYCHQWSNLTQVSELKRYDDMRLSDEGYACLSCRVAVSCRVALDVMNISV